MREDADPTPIWVDHFSGSIFRNFPSNGHLLDIGSGDGRLVPLLPDLGVAPGHYLGVDPAEAQVRFAQKRFPGHTFEVGSIYEVGARHPSRFDGFWCGCVLMHIPRVRLAEALSSLRSSLKAGAVGLISTPGGEGEEESDNGFLLTLYGFEELYGAFTAAGFDSDFHTPNGFMILGSIRAV